MTLHILNRENSLLEVFLSEIRNIEIQHDRMRFRRNLERVGEIMAYEISKTFAYAPHTIETPINPIDVQLPAQDIVIATILRAGLPFHHGFLNYFDRAENAFISARRAYNPAEEAMEVRFDSIYTPLMYLFAPQIIGLMTPVEEIRELGVMALRIEAFAEPMFAASIVAYGVFVGAADTLVPCLMNFFSIWAVRLSLAALLAPSLGLKGVWVAMCVELCFRGVIFLIRLKRERWMKV